VHEREKSNENTPFPNVGICTLSESNLRRNIVSNRVYTVIHLPYCRNCGREISQDSRFCPHCGASQVAPEVQRERVAVRERPSSSGAVQAVVLIIILLGFVFFAATVQVFDCPSCNNSPLFRWACPYCGHDGRVTLFELLSYSFRGS